jgi:hypothetical protein
VIHRYDSDINRRFLEGKKPHKKPVIASFGEGK